MYMEHGGYTIMNNDLLSTQSDFGISCEKFIDMRSVKVCGGVVCSLAFLEWSTMSFSGSIATTSRTPVKIKRMLVTARGVILKY